MHSKLSFTEALLLLIGTQIGAGILGLPYTMKHAGILGVGIIILMGFITMITALFILDSMQGGENVSLSGLASTKLGTVAGTITFISIILYGYGAILAYIAGSGTLLASVFHISPQIGTVIFWAVMSGVVYFGLSASGKAEVIIGISLLIALSVAILLVIPGIQVNNLMKFDISQILPLIGISMFAYASHLIVPEIYASTGRKTARKVVVWGFLIPMIFYALFVLAFVGAYGSGVPEMAMMAISGQFGILGTALGILVPLTAISTSFIGIALSQMNNIQAVVKHHTLAWLLTVSVPLIMYMAGMTSFTGALSAAGAFGGLIFAGIIPVMLYLKSSQEKRYIHLAYSLLSLFALVFIANIFR